ncbi:MarR family winged helix-turn-helix transcriptional regulator [Faecalibacter rhinopitheci]|uniref:HTH-type transcriptional regulator SarZ n=1 Tax=Faecalibacter rhinopitheci TaxID=2779678 RepID=A0A8J7FXQ2_9FLAO|nr:MarR family transcriptional regulator [Faecalibacter rhinopitheci]MBF0597573.1 MarR family transcriptional regulator [Faecalibacter rhinopitheci]
MSNLDDLKLSNQLCFPIYALAKEMINQYRPFLDDLDLTYPQYLVMLVLWENDHLTVGQIGDKLGLDSGTLTPLLKRLEQKGVVTRIRCSTDERIVRISLTEKGSHLKMNACKVPLQMKDKFDLTDEELLTFKRIIHKILHSKI